MGNYSHTEKVTGLLDYLLHVVKRPDLYPESLNLVLVILITTKVVGVEISLRTFDGTFGLVSHFFLDVLGDVQVAVRNTVDFMRVGFLFLDRAVADHFNFGIFYKLNNFSVVDVITDDKIGA